MNMVLEIRLYQNSRSFIWGTVTHSISLIPLSAPKCMLSSHLQGRKAPQTSLPRGAEWAIPQAPQTSPKLEAQIPAIRAEGGNIMPGNTPGPAASRPGASLRSIKLVVCSWVWPVDVFCLAFVMFTNIWTTCQYILKSGDFMSPSLLHSSRWPVWPLSARALRVLGWLYQNLHWPFIHVLWLLLDYFWFLKLSEWIPLYFLYF